MEGINERLLDEYLEVLEKSQQWPPRMISKLETFIRTADDFDLFKINPFKFAVNLNFDEDEVLELFLRSSKEGIFMMNWGLVCPTCGADVGSFRSLKSVSSHFFCNICRVESQSNLDEHIMVTFTVNPNIRKISYHDPDSLSIDDYLQHYRYSREGRVPMTGETFPEYVKKYIRDKFDLLPGHSKNITITADSGYVLGFDLHGEGGFCITISPEGKKAPSDLMMAIKPGDYYYSPDHTYLPGDISFIVKSHCSDKSRMVILFEPPVDASRQQPVLKFDKFLTGKMLLNNNMFNKLFRNDVQVGQEGIGVKDITILFTDLKSSTELYEKIGDMEAFSLVSRHFQFLENIVADHNGTVIKTIGDSIMATFLNPLEAIEAAVEMNHKISEFNRKQTGQDLILKIGLHKGPSIAVTLNNQLDYFGRTVNIASRIQHLANPEEINITKDIYEFPDITQKLNGLHIDPVKTRIKGIDEDFQIYRIYQ